MAHKSSPGLVFIGLFLLPFATVGIGTAVTGLWRTAQGNWRDGLLLLLFGVVFAGFAAAVITLVLLGRRKQKELEQLQARHPDKPWLWRRDWAEGRIPDNTRTTVWVAWVFAVFWSSVTIPIGWAGIITAARESNPKLYLVLVFPLVGVGLLAWAIRLTLRRVKYGSSWLTLSSVPGVVGRGIAGAVRIPAALGPENGFDATLTCLRRITTRNGKSSSTSERILWQEENRVNGISIRDVAGPGMQVPVAFRIPADAAGSDSTNPNDQTVWRLTLSANVPGVDYHASFEVPVFRTGDISAGDDVEYPAVSLATAAPYRQPATSRITVKRNQRGTEIFFPAARNPGVALGTTIFTILWTGLVFLLVSWDAPRVFPIVFGLFDLLLIAGVLQLWFGVSRIVASRAGATVARGFVFTGRERTMEAAHIADVTIKIGMQAGGTPYYDVVLIRQDGKAVIVGRSVRDKREAGWLVQTLKEAMGLMKPGADESSRPVIQQA